MPNDKRNALPFLLLIAGALLALGASKAASFIPPLRKGSIKSKFGSRDNPFGEGTELHNGVDIGVPQGTNVYSIGKGVVSSSYSTEKGGKQLVLTLDNGYRAGYAHLYFTLVKVGDPVDRGTLIAQSGKTGKITGAHLHFTLRNKEGVYVDPEKYIRFVV